MPGQEMQYIPHEVYSLSSEITVSLEKSPVEFRAPHLWGIMVYCHSKAGSVLEKSQVIAFSMSILH